MDTRTEYAAAAPLSILKEEEVYIRPDGSTFTRSDIFVKIAVTFRDKMLSDLKGPPLSVLFCIALHCGETMESWPSLATIEKETGYSRQAVIDAIHSLEKKNLISVVRRKQKVNLYTIHAFLSMGKPQPSSPNVPPSPSARPDSLPSRHEEETIKKKPIKKKIAEAAKDPETLDPPPLTSIQTHTGLRAVRSTSTEEVILEIHDQQDRSINCPACQTSTTEWPTTEAERRKPKSLRCTGCGAFLIVHGYRAYDGKERTYKHPHLPEPGWRIEVTMADGTVRVMEGITDVQLKEFARYWQNWPVICMEKLIWSDTAEFIKLKHCSPDEILGYVCSAIQTNLRRIAAKESLEAELVADEEEQMAKIPSSLFTDEPRWMSE